MCSMHYLHNMHSLHDAGCQKFAAVNKTCAASLLTGTMGFLKFMARVRVRVKYIFCMTCLQCIICIIRIVCMMQVVKISPLLIKAVQPAFLRGAMRFMKFRVRVKAIFCMTCLQCIICIIRIVYIMQVVKNSPPLIKPVQPAFLQELWNFSNLWLGSGLWLYL